MANGESTSDRIKELQQERSLLQWMIDNQKRVNNGITGYVRAKREVLVIDQQIAEAAKQLEAAEAAQQEERRRFAEEQERERAAASEESAAAA